MKLTLYTRFPSVVADLVESRYKRIVVTTIDEIGPITQNADSIEFSYRYEGKFDEQPIYGWIMWGFGFGIIHSYELTKPNARYRERAYPVSEEQP